MAQSGQVERDGRELPASSYVILGLLATEGPGTPYEMKRAIDESIGFFWDFPRAQLYVDPERLARDGLLRVEQEATGRRRRVYTITPAGEEALLGWLHAEATPEVEMRDTGLLKLFFGSLLNAPDVAALARRERDLHRRRLTVYETIQAGMQGTPHQQCAAATLKMGLAYERLSISFWEDILASPPADE